MNIVPSWSSRQLRKGPLASETYRIFSAWRFDENIATNMKRGVNGAFGTAGWEREVRSTISSRLRNFDAVRPLILLAKGGMPFGDWRDCYRLFLVACEEPLRTFVLGWLHRETQGGRHLVRAGDLRDFLSETMSQAGQRPLSEYGQVRATRDLLRAATELGLLTSRSATKSIEHVTMGDVTFVFYVHLIAELESSASRVVDSPYWRAAMMNPSDVHAALLRLHQFRRLEYQVAGSLVQLSLPFESATACARAVAA